MTTDEMDVLLIEDNPGDARLIEEELKDVQNLRIDLVHEDNLADGLQAVAEREFDVALLDLSLPDSSGLDTVRRMRNAATRIPIVVLTGLEDERMALDTLKEGAQDYVVKGEYTGNLLARVMRYAMERHQATREMEELRRKLSMTEKLSTMGALVSDVANEINSFTETISNNLFEIRRRVNAAADEGDADLPNLMEQVNEATVGSMEAVDRINRHLRDLRRFYRTGPEDREERDLQEVAEEALDLFAPADDRGVKVKTDLHPTPAVLVNTPQVQQVVLALLTNATEAVGSREGSVVLETDTEDGSAVLRVRDSGPGIPSDVQDRIFDPFFSTQEGNDGLGLSIARRIVESHEGTITFETGSDGTTFTVELPAAS